MTTEIIKLVLKRGSTNRAAAYTGPEGEVVVDTGLDTLRIQDGVTVGGIILSKEGHGHGIYDVNGLSAALGLKAPLDSPGLTGVPTAPTAAVGTASKQLATTEFVATALASSISGTASSATKLATARVISLSGDATGAVSFDGSANVVLNVSVADDSHSHSFSNITSLPTTLAGYGISDAQPKDSDLTAIAALTSYGMITRTGSGTAVTRSLAASGNGIQITNGDGLAGNPTVTSNAVSINQASTLVFRDASGNFAANVITASLTGNASSATKLATARTLSLSGDATGSATFDGTANAAVVVTLANTGVTAGTYKSVTVDTKGRITSASNPTTLSGYGITDAAPLNSPALIGVPTAPTAALGTNSTQLATTAFVAAAVAVAQVTGGAIDGTPIGATTASTGRFTTLNTTGDLTVGGNLVVNGASFIANSTVTTVSDPVMTLGGDAAPTVNDGKDRGIEFRWHNGTSAKLGFFGFDRSSGCFTFIPDATNAGEVFSGAAGTIAANFRGPLDGNAATASRLSTARRISLSGDVSGWNNFDGTSDITIPVNLPDTGVSPGTYGSAARTLVAQVDTKGRIVGLTSQIAAPVFANITDKPTTLSGYGITDGAPINSPALTGVPTAPTAPVGTRTTQLATTAFVTEAISQVQSTTTITGGTINGTPIGASTASSGRFTTLSVLNDSDVAGSLVVGGQLFVSQNASLMSANVNGNLVVGGNLTVQGTTTTANSMTVTVSDPVMTLGGNFAPTTNDGKDRGIEFRWHNGTSAKLGFFGFDSDTREFAFIPEATNAGEVFSGTVGTVRANLKGDVIGNAATATRLATARTVSVSGDATGSVGFDGTVNVNIPLTLADTGVPAGTYTKVTVDAKGRVLAGSQATTLADYGLTDAAPINSPAFTGTPTAPTPPAESNGTDLATTAFIHRAISQAINVIDGGTL